MKRFFILFPSVLLLLVIVILTEKNGNRIIEINNPVNPVLQVEPVSGLTPEKCDLGYAESKSVHDFTLEIANASNENWQDIRIDIECDCITVLDTPKIIPAKSKVPVRLQFTAPDITGPYTKTITVTAGEKSWQSRFHARIDAPLRVEPKNVIFSGKEKEIPITIFNDGTVPVRLLYATSTPSLCTVKIGAEPIKPNSQTTLTITLTDFTPNRLIALNIQTNHRKQKKIIVPIQTK